MHKLLIAMYNKKVDGCDRLDQLLTPVPGFIGYCIKYKLRYTQSTCEAQPKYNYKLGICDEGSCTPEYQTEGVQ